MPIARPNISLSPYDIANMVQQRFRLDMGADNNRIERKQKELQAQRKAIESPEFQKQLDANTKSLMSLQKEVEMFKHEQQRQEIESQRAFQNTSEFREMMGNLAEIRQSIKHTREMAQAESDRIQTSIDRQIQSSQKAYNQKLETALEQYKTQHMKDMNVLYDRQSRLHAEAEAREQSQNDLIKQVLEEQKTEYMKQINDLKTQQAQIEANAIAREETRDQLIEKARVERETKLRKEINDRFDRFDSETAKLEERVMEQKGELHAKGLKQTKKAAQKAANDKAKVQVQNENLEELIEVSRKENENIKRQAYLDELRTQGAADAKKVGEAKAQQELERIRLEREIEFEKQRHKALLDKEIVVKESKKIIDDLQGQIQAIKASDPTSRLTGDPALIEVDLYMLGDEQEKYKEAQRRFAETRYYQHAMLNLNKEADEIAKVIRDSGQGVNFSQLYGKDPADVVRAMGKLALMRQGREVLSENINEIFPAVQTRLNEIERRAEQVAVRERTIGAREAEWTNQLAEARIIIQNQQKQLAVANQQLAMATGQQPG